jgi:hypothetical protein
MTKEFKVGDKVCHIGFGNGVVDVVDEEFEAGVTVKFSEKHQHFRSDGRYFTDDKFPSIYHGHGTFQFIPYPEPEYTWQWLYLNMSTNMYETSSRHKSEADFIVCRGYAPEWYERIERSKEPA